MRHSAFTLWLIPLLLPLVILCSPEAHDPLGLRELGDGMKVLFIGNSLTYSNDLPRMVQIVGEAAGEEIAVRSLSVGDFSLEDHWQQGDAQAAIAAADWDVVVLQQGPSSLALDKIHLREWAQKFDTVIRAQGARTSLFMVWPEASRPAALDAVTAAYTQAADAVEGMLFPVGEAWRSAWVRDAGLVFYGPDGFNPSELGSALAALVIYQQLFGRSPVGLPDRMVSVTKGLGTLQLPARLSLLLQEAAAEANARFGRR